MSNLFSPVVLKFAFLRQVENFYQVVKTFTSAAGKCQF